jgi:hypothetical protein
MFIAFIFLFLNESADGKANFRMLKKLAGISLMSSFEITFFILQFLHSALLH